MSDLQWRNDMPITLTEARHVAFVFGELTAKAKMLADQIKSYGGISIEDFPGHDGTEEQQTAAKARMQQTLLSLEAVGKMLRQMQATLSDNETTVEEALVRVAQKIPERSVKF